MVTEGKAITLEEYRGRYQGPPTAGEVCSTVLLDYRVREQLGSPAASRGADLAGVGLSDSVANV